MNVLRVLILMAVVATATTARTHADENSFAAVIQLASAPTQALYQQILLARTDAQRLAAFSDFEVAFKSEFKSRKEIRDAALQVTNGNGGYPNFQLQLLNSTQLNLRTYTKYIESHPQRVVATRVAGPSEVPTYLRRRVNYDQIRSFEDLFRRGEFSDYKALWEQAQGDAGQPAEQAQWYQSELSKKLHALFENDSDFRAWVQKQSKRSGPVSGLDLRLAKSIIGPVNTALTFASTSAPQLPTRTTNIPALLARIDQASPQPTVDSLFQTGSFADLRDGWDGVNRRWADPKARTTALRTFTRQVMTRFQKDPAFRDAAATVTGGEKNFGAFMEAVVHAAGLTSADMTPDQSVLSDGFQSGTPARPQLLASPRAARSNRSLTVSFGRSPNDKSAAADAAAMAAASEKVANENANSIDSAAALQQVLNKLSKSDVMDQITRNPRSCTTRLTVASAAALVAMGMLALLMKGHDEEGHKVLSPEQLALLTPEERARVEQNSSDRAVGGAGIARKKDSASNQPADGALAPAVVNAPPVIDPVAIPNFVVIPSNVVTPPTADPTASIVMRAPELPKVGAEVSVNGIDGKPGTNGGNGTNGTQGSSGVAGTAGTAGTAGIAGTPGLAGAPGSAGAAGVAGTAGTSGAVGTPGLTGTPGISSDALADAGKILRPGDKNDSLNNRGVPSTPSVAGPGAIAGLSAAKPAEQKIADKQNTDRQNIEKQNTDKENSDKKNTDKKNTDKKDSSVNIAVVGADGKPGAPGSNGAAGNTGALGPVGATGIAGPAGASGVAGAVGAAGTPGISTWLPKFPGFPQFPLAPSVKGADGKGAPALPAGPMVTDARNKTDSNSDGKTEGKLKASDARGTPGIPGVQKGDGKKDSLVRVGATGEKGPSGSPLGPTLSGSSPVLGTPTLPAFSWHPSLSWFPDLSRYFQAPKDSSDAKRSTIVASSPGAIIPDARVAVGAVADSAPLSTGALDAAGEPEFVPQFDPSAVLNLDGKSTEELREMLKYKVDNSKKIQALIDNAFLRHEKANYLKKELARNDQQAKQILDTLKGNYKKEGSPAKPASRPSDAPLAVQFPAAVVKAPPAAAIVPAKTVDKPAAKSDIKSPAKPATQPLSVPPTTDSHAKPTTQSTVVEPGVLRSLPMTNDPAPAPTPTTPPAIKQVSLENYDLVADSAYAGTGVGPRYSVDGKNYAIVKFQVHRGFGPLRGAFGEDAAWTVVLEDWSTGSRHYYLPKGGDANTLPPEVVALQNTLKADSSKNAKIFLSEMGQFRPFGHEHPDNPKAYLEVRNNSLQSIKAAEANQNVQKEIQKLQTRQTKIQNDIAYWEDMYIKHTPGTPQYDRYVGELMEKYKRRYKDAAHRFERAKADIANEAEDTQRDAEVRHLRPLRSERDKLESQIAAKQSTLQ